MIITVTFSNYQEVEKFQKKLKSQIKEYNEKIDEYERVKRKYAKGKGTFTESMLKIYNEVASEQLPIYRKKVFEAIELFNKCSTEELSFEVSSPEFKLIYMICTVDFMERL